MYVAQRMAGVWLAFGVAMPTYPIPLNPSYADARRKKIHSKEFLTLHIIEHRMSFRVSALVTAGGSDDSLTLASLTLASLVVQDVQHFHGHHAATLSRLTR
jgi:hypothetical protein